MHQNIKNNNVKSLDAKLYNAKYYDFMLYKGEAAYQDKNDLDNMSIADFSSLNIISGILYSTVLWSGATNEGVVMNDIGLTGMDNGLISFKRDRITNEEFLELLINSQYKIESGDTRLFLTPVTGNTQEYDYPMYLVETDEEKYIVCKGGFYQGFFKLYGHEYQVLPHKIDDEWFMHFELRPRSDYEVADNTVNYLRPNNEGIFFFMGTRAENKFWPFYKTDKDVTDTMKKINAQTEGYFSGCGESGETYNINENNIVFLENEWLSEEIEADEPEEGYFVIGDGYFICELSGSTAKKVRPSTSTLIFESSRYPSVKQSLNVYDFNPNSYCGCSGPSCEIKPEEPECVCDSYFGDEYYDDRCPISGNNKIFVNEYIGSGVTINKNGYDDSMGHAMSATGYHEIITDNKFLLFDRTPSGFTVDTWVEGTEVMLTRRQNWPNANYFLLMDRTPTGYTVNTIDQYNWAHEYDYNIHKDIRGNVFALRITKDGAIGYRYGILNCDAENRYEVIEEYSKPNLVKMDEWNSINVRFAVMNPAHSHCDNRKPRKMRIMFYVNGYLVFISKEITAFFFKEIDEVAQKQEAVPFNISLGGGTLGLLESILPNYYAISDYILPIERDFCGTFMGDIKSFKMYGGFINYKTILDLLS
jgi:hypothetical protein